MRRKVSAAAAAELVTKLEALARDAEAKIDASAAEPIDTDEATRLYERAANYTHAATLARNLLEVPR